MTLPLPFPVTILPGIGPKIPPAEAVGTLLEHGVELFRAEGQPSPALLDEGGMYRYLYMRGKAAAEALPELAAWYHDALPVVERVVGEPVVTAEDPESAITAKLYQRGFGEQGAHRDTNPVTVLAYLTGGGAPTEIENIDGTVMALTPRAGDVLIFPGRRLRHWVPVGSTDRVTVSFNYYTIGDRWRPDGINELVYGA